MLRWLSADSYGVVMAEEKVRLGGMALANGVLVHGPTSWAAAVRTDRRRDRGGERPQAAVPRGTGRWCGARPGCSRRCSYCRGCAAAFREARFAFQRPAVLASLAAAGVGGRAIRATRLPPALQELAAGALALTPALLALRERDLAAYHGAEHVSIGTYEHGDAGREGARTMRHASRRALAAGHRRRRDARR